MLFPSVRIYGAALVAATLCLAGPLAVAASDLNHNVAAVVGRASPAPSPLLVGELARRDPMSVSRAQPLEKRLSTDFILDHEWKNEILFGGTVGGRMAGGGSVGTGADGLSFDVTCIECWTKGMVTANLKSEDIVNPVVRLDFNGVEAYVDLGVTSTGGATYAVNLFSSQDPSGLGLQGLSLGLVFHLDLVFSISDDIDLTGGFYVKLADGSFLETEVFTGKITDHLFENLATKPLEVEVQAGSATFKAALRVRVECGAEADLDFVGVGASAVMGIYANIVEFVAELGPAPNCALQSREWFDLNVGAFARLGVEVDFTSAGVAVPTVSTTLIDSPTWTQCLQDVLPTESESSFIASVAEPTETSEPSGAVLPPPDTPVGEDDDGATLPPPDTVVAKENEEEVGEETKEEVEDDGYVKDAAPEKRDSEEYQTNDEEDGTLSYPTMSTSMSESMYPAAPAPTSAEAAMVAPAAGMAQEYTVTRCAVPVINCPASLQREVVVTKMLDPNAPKPTATIHVFTDVAFLTPCETPIVETYTPPSRLDQGDDEPPCDDEEGSSSESATPQTLTSTMTVTSTIDDYPFTHRKRPTSTVTVTSTARETSGSSSSSAPAPAVETTPPKQEQPHLPMVNISVWMSTASKASSLVMGNLAGGPAPVPSPSDKPVIAPEAVAPASQKSPSDAEASAAPVVVAGAARLGGPSSGGVWASAAAVLVAAAWGRMGL